MPSTMSLRGKPYQITSLTDVRAIADALNHPDRKGVSRMARNNRLAVIHNDGTVVIYGITAPSNVFGCDITTTSGSKKLGSALIAALNRARVVKLTLASPIRNASYHDAGGTTHSVSVGNQALQELMGQYSPLVLKGNRRCKMGKMQQLVQHTPRFLTVKLTKPDTFEAIVMTKESEWPPKVYDTNARLERVKFDTITIFSEGSGLTRFVFTDTQSNECLLADPVRSLRLVKEAQGRNPPVYGPDLFDEVVSGMKKP